MFCLNARLRASNQRSKIWKPSAIRGLFPLENIPGMISFLAGKPNPSTFPFESITINLKPSLPLPGQTNGHTNGSSASTESVTIDGADLAEALQYGPTSGYPRLVKVRLPSGQTASSAYT